jgi:predicted RNase H-like HicB family nuclease
MGGSSGEGEGMIYAARYSYKVVWDPEDRDFIGTCREFPHLSHFAASREDALEGINKLVLASILILREKGLPVPEPIAWCDESD